MKNKALKKIWNIVTSVLVALVVLLAVGFLVTVVVVAELFGPGG